MTVPHGGAALAGPIAGSAAPVELAEGPAAVARLAGLLRGRTWTALTGAGASTDSGIPDYRGPTSVRATPMLYAEFVGSTAAQQRYWARSYLGWGRMKNARPNAGHRALVDLESS
jgi:NAD-dependent SIR2 family protein deacetylase